MASPKNWVHPADLEYGHPSPPENPLAWKEIDALFARHGQLPPPTRLRDELVGWLLAYRAAGRP